MDNTENTVNNTENRTNQAGSSIYSSGETEINLVELFMVYIRKWLILGIISLAAALIVFILISFVLNKNTRQYSASFLFEYPGKEEMLYPDGTSFSFYDFVSAENIEKTISNNMDKFGKMTVDDTIRNIFVEQAYEEAKDGEKTLTGYYTLTGNAKFFGGFDDFRDFSAALVETVANNIKEMSQTSYYYAFLDAYDNSDTFSQKLDYLSRQKDYIIGFYDKWISDYGQQYSADACSLVKYNGDVESAFSKDTYDKLEYELSKRRYTFDPKSDEKTTLEISIEILQDEYDDNAMKIEALSQALENLRKTENNSASDITTKSNETYFYEKIAELTERQIDINREITNVRTQIDNLTLDSATALYTEKLDEVRKALADQTMILRRVANSVYNDKTEFVFDSLSYKTTGTKSAPLFATVTFVLAYLVVGFIIFAVESYEEDKKKK